MAQEVTGSYPRLSRLPHSRNPGERVEWTARLPALVQRSQASNSSSVRRGMRNFNPLVLSFGLARYIRSNSSLFMACIRPPPTPVMEMMDAQGFSCSLLSMWPHVVPSTMAAPQFVF